MKRSAQVKPSNAIPSCLRTTVASDVRRVLPFAIVGAHADSHARAAEQPGPPQPDRPAAGHQHLRVVTAHTQPSPLSSTEPPPTPPRSPKAGRGSAGAGRN